MNPYHELEKKLGIRFKNRELLDMVFVHRSYVNEHPSEKKDHNERLEFLGDAVLELVTTEFLYRTFPESQEGELTTLRSALVKGKHLAEVSQELGLGSYLYLSRGEEKSGGRKKHYLLANAIEALIGALYLDRGFKIAHAFIDRFILQGLGNILQRGLHIDPKSRFQEYAQERLGITPTYRVLLEVGPDHNKTFTVAACLGDECVAEGKGPSKQKAEQEAALRALQKKGWL